MRKSKTQCRRGETDGAGTKSVTQSAAHDVHLTVCRHGVERAEDLEPDRTGVHERSSGSSSIKIALFILVLLAAGLGVSLFLFKDKLFG